MSFVDETEKACLSLKGGKASGESVGFGLWEAANNWRLFATFDSRQCEQWPRVDKVSAEQFSRQQKSSGYQTTGRHPRTGDWLAAGRCRHRSLLICCLTASCWKTNYLHDTFCWVLMLTATSHKLLCNVCMLVISCFVFINNSLFINANI